MWRKADLEVFACYSHSNAGWEIQNNQKETRLETVPSQMSHHKMC